MCNTDILVQSSIKSVTPLQNVTPFFHTSVTVSNSTTKISEISISHLLSVRKVSRGVGIYSLHGVRADCKLPSHWDHFPPSYWCIKAWNQTLLPWSTHHFSFQQIIWSDCRNVTWKIGKPWIINYPTPLLTGWASWEVSLLIQFKARWHPWASCWCSAWAGWLHNCVFSIWKSNKM